MYFIIGGDGKEYGPISDADIRLWISEGRLNAQSQAKAESDAAFRPLSAFPEFANAFAAGDATAVPSAPANWDERDYELDIGGCVSRGWDLFKENMGILLGSFLLGIVILFAANAMVSGLVTVLVPQTWMQSVVFRQFFNVGLQILLALINGPLLGGIFYIFIQTMRRQPADTGKIFIGFQKAFSQLFLGNFVVAFFVGLCFVPFNLVAAAKIQPLLEQLRHTNNPQQSFPELMSAFGAAFPILAICLIPMTYLAVNWQFTLPLIVDKQMDFWTAMKTSWKMVHKHWFAVFGLTVLLGLINTVGVLFCCVGVLFTAPMTIAATVYAYETIFCESQNH